MAEGYIIVTGATRGIGAAIARELTAQGMRVAGLTRSGETAAGEGFVCDVADEAGFAKAIAAVAAKGPIVGLVNNAGQYEEHKSASLAAAEFDSLMHINATSMLVGCREVYPHLKQCGGGLIVNIGSFFDKLGVTRSVAYCASKAAVGAITRCLAVEWAADNIRVLDVAPGYVATDLNADFREKESVKTWIRRRIPVARPGQPEEVGRLVASLFKSEIGFLTGETLYIDGGQGMFH
jgi:NAD(P)-dependent dehydrogenase (short-subunit alcohol dehydrogenase family)